MHGLLDKVELARSGDRTAAAFVYEQTYADNPELALEAYFAAQGPFPADNLALDSAIQHDLLGAGEALPSGAEPPQLYESEQSFAEAVQLLLNNRQLGLYEDDDGVVLLDIPYRIEEASVRTPEVEVVASAPPRLSRRPGRRMHQVPPSPQALSPEYIQQDKSISAVVGIGVAAFVGWLAYRYVQKGKRTQE